MKIDSTNHNSTSQTTSHDSIFPLIDIRHFKKLANQIIILRKINKEEKSRKEGRNSIEERFDEVFKAWFQDISA